MPFLDKKDELSETLLEEEEVLLELEEVESPLVESDELELEEVEGETEVDELVEVDEALHAFLDALVVEERSVDDLL